MKPLKGARTAAGGDDSERRNVKSVEKAAAVLGAFRGRKRFLSLGEIAAATGLDKSAAQRFTRTLKEIGYLEQDPDTRQYALGKRVLDLSFDYLRSNPLVERAAPVLVDLRKAVGERVDLSLLDGDFLIYAFRLQSKREALPAALVGRRVPVFCTAGGRAILSRLSDAEARRIVERSERTAKTPKTLTDPAEIMKRVRAARMKGYAIQSEEWRLGEVVAAAAITDRQGRPVAAVHIVASASEWAADEFERRMGPLAAATAQDISD